MENKSNRNLLLILLGVALLLCCCCVVIAGLVGLSAFRNVVSSGTGSEQPVIVVTRIATATPRRVRRRPSPRRQPNRGWQP